MSLNLNVFKEYDLRGVDEIEKLGGQPEWCKTGHSLIKAKMHEIAAKFAGEMSGHMFFADEYHGFDDALYYSTAETRIPCPDERKVQIVEELKRQLAESYEIIDVDGVRALFAE